MKSTFGILIDCVSYSLVTFCTVSMVAQGSGPTSVFKIGTFDRSSMEFATGVPNQRVNFVVGQSDPAKAWFASQEAEVTSAKVVSTAAERSVADALVACSVFQIGLSILSLLSILLVLCASSSRIQLPKSCL